MRIAKQIPLVSTNQLAEVKAFYTRHFGFRATLDVPEYLALVSEDGSVELGFMPPCEGAKAINGAGLTLCLQVQSADAEHSRIAPLGLRVTRSLQDNAWGDRSFVVEDPIGVSLYIHHPIPPTGKYGQASSNSA